MRGYVGESCDKSMRQGTKRAVRTHYHRNTHMTAKESGHKREMNWV